MAIVGAFLAVLASSYSPVRSVFQCVTWVRAEVCTSAVWCYTERSTACEYTSIYLCSQGLERQGYHDLFMVNSTKGCGEAELAWARAAKGEG
eukprot:15092348-Alexandrium_andersonii.AAC.1